MRTDARYKPGASLIMRVEEEQICAANFALIKAPHVQQQSGLCCVEIRALHWLGWTPEGATFLGSKRRIINIILHFYLKRKSAKFV
jgi:hypothetical protein